MKRITVGLVFGLAILVTLGLFYMPKLWFGNAEPPSLVKPPREEFAAERAPAAVADVPFDAKRALKYLDDICKIGPRISGEDGMAKQQELLKKHFDDLGGKLEWQTFKATQQSRPRQQVSMANLIVTWHPERQRRIIICSHYDTRPIADQEPDPRKWRLPFISANDGGSGVAFLMELAHHMKDLKTDLGVDFIFFDGEEYVFDPDSDKYFLGSEYFARNYQKNRPKHRYVAAVLLDMIAGKNPRFPVEQHSWAQAGALVEEIWKIADEQQCAAFQYRNGPAVRDDHLALNAVGIPAVDIIDFNYPHWHRLTDVPANCSGEGLTQVARVLSVWLQRAK